MSEEKVVIYPNKGVVDKKQNYEAAQKKVNEAAAALQKAKEEASHSTGNVEINVDSDKVYFINLADLHIPEGNMYALVDTLKELAKIPNVYFGIGGDQINNSIVSSVGDTHTEILNGTEQIKLLASIIKEVDKEIPLIDRIAYIRTGNHEVRSENATSLNPSYLLAAELGIQERYVKNIARVVFNLNDAKNPNKKVKVVGITAHGSKKPGQAGAQADDALKNDIDAGADFIIEEHNHRAAIATTYKEINVKGRVNSKLKPVTYVNFGAMIPGGDYADYAQYSFPKITQGQLLRIAATETDPKIDFINYQSLVNSLAQKHLKKIDLTFKMLEKADYKTPAEITRAFKTTTNKLYKEVLKDYDKDMAKDLAFQKDNGVSDKIFFVPLSGFQIGDEGIKNTKEIKEKIEILSKLNGSCKIVLNGDMLHYKKAITIGQGKKPQKFVDDTYDYIRELAELLEPIKHKIIGINYGREEFNIMKYQDEELAKYAMKNNQMDEKLVYMPYNKEKLAREQRKIQRRQVNKYNEDLLDRETGNFLKDLHNLDEQFYKLFTVTMDGFGEMEKEDQYAIIRQTVEQFNNIQADDDIKYEKEAKSTNEIAKASKKKSKSEKQTEFIKDLLYKKLRMENKLLSTSHNKTYIDYVFPLTEVKDKKPHENLLAHMLCDYLNIDPKNITINTQLNQNSAVYAKVKDDTNKVRNVAFYGSASTSLAGRSAVLGHLETKKALAPGANVYYTNTILGKEFMVMDNTILEDENKENYQQDTYFISNGTLSGRQQKELSASKVYKFYATATGREEETLSNGIYQNAYKDFNLFCEDLNYETVLLEDDVLGEIIKNQASVAYQKAVTKLEQKKTREKIKNLVTKFDKTLSPKEDEDKTVN